MRYLLVLLILASASALGAAPQSAFAADEAPEGDHAAVQARQTGDGADDTRVEVQLVVLGIAVGVVVVFGLAAYLVRKKLGLVAPPPDQSPEEHH